MWLALAGTGLFAAALAVGLTVLPSLVWRTVVREADRRGVTLRDCELDLGLKTLTLSRCSFRMSTFREVTGSIERVEVALSSFTPKAVEVRGAHVAVRGVPRFQDFAYGLRHRPTDAVPISVSGGDLEWTLEGAEAPWLSLSGLRYESTSGNVAADARALERFAGTLSGSAELLSLKLAARGRPATDLTFVGEQRHDSLDLVLELHEVQLAELEGSYLDFPPELERSRADGRLHLRIPVGLTAEMPSGEYRIVLTGINFPVPRELEGLVYGTPAVLTGSLALTRNLERAEIEQAGFSIGDLQMRGRGRLELLERAAGFELSLAGDLACHHVVRSAAAAHAGSELAKAAGRIASRSLKGAVQVTTALTGNSRELEHANVVTSIGVGCGLKPLPLDGLMKLPVELLQQLPKLPSVSAAPPLPDTSARPLHDGASLGGAQTSTAPSAR